MQLSIVMSVYNGEDYLEEAVDSILNQTFTDFEFIVVNNASSDRTTGILEKSMDPRMRIFNLPRNVGLARALNFGIAQAQYDWIVRQDADDVSLPNRLEEQVKHILSSRDMVAVASMVQAIPGKHPVEGPILRGAEWSNSVLSREQIKQKRFLAPPVVHGSVTFSKKVFDDIGGYSPDYTIGMDFDLWIRMLEAGNIDKVPMHLYQYRVHSESLSHKNERETCIESLQIASGHIQSMLYKLNKVMPAFLVIGPREGCRFFEAHIRPVNGINVQYYMINQLDHKLPAASQWIEQGVIDGILVLDGPLSASVMNILQLYGLKPNENLFQLWNAFI